MKKLLLIPIIFLLCGCISPRVNPFDDPVLMQQKVQVIRNKALVEKNKYIEEHPNLSLEVKTAILNYQVVIGMTKEEVVIAWGWPGETSNIETERKVIDIWEYDFPDVSYKFMNHSKLYFKDGYLVKVRNKT
jgi:hypothetical protein